MGLHKDGKEQEHEIRRVSQAWKNVVDIERGRNEAISEQRGQEKQRKETVVL
jgi:hypothetical protein